MTAPRFLGILAGLLFLSSGATVAQPAAQPPMPSPTPSGGAPTSAPAPAPSGLQLPGFGLMGPSPQQYAAFVKNTERQSGLIDIVKKDDDIYFDLGPDQLDRPFIVAPVLASGVGAEAFAGRIFSTFVIEFHRVGRRVLWIDKNSDFSAPPNSPAANALAISVTDSVINSSPIAAEDEKQKRIVIPASFFLTDFENVGKDLGGGGQSPILLLLGSPHPGFTVDASRSYIEKTKALPKNDEILASLAFAGPPGDDVSGAPDARGVRLRMHYSIVDPPDPNGYVPRIADDRVGYFITAQKRFDNDALPTPFVRYIDRWNFNNGPIVYYLTDEIPAEYKEPIRRALLQWNAAFAKIGIPNAIEVRDQPSDPSWDPDDVRYSTVRWITSDHPAFVAYGPAIDDPRTGEIMRVEVVIDGEEMRAVKRGYADIVAPTHPNANTLDASGLPLPMARRALDCGGSDDCDTFGQDSAEIAAAGTFALRSFGATPATMDHYAEDYLQSVVLHESGHNLGLRHNFVASTLYSLAQIHDPHFSREHGIVGSVMGYTPVNLSPPGQPQGEYFQLRLGPYDEWAIRYGYERFPSIRRPEDEIIPLRGIADEGSRPEYAYATDEDANGPLAVDPRIATFALSSDPLAFEKNQFDVVDNLIGKLDGAYPREDQPYYEERETFLTIMRQYGRAAALATKWIGGIYTSRDHRGQPGGKHPFWPVPRERSREAFALLAANVLSSRALRFSPQLLSDLGANHYLHRGVDYVEQPDFPVEEYVGDLQDLVMFSLFSPDTMGRLADNALKVGPGERTMTLGDLYGWTQDAVWDDLGPQRSPGDAIHRGLQRRYTRLMIAFSLAPSFLVEALGYPSDTQALARFELHRLSDRLRVALRSNRLDVETRAHLEDTQSRVDRALSPNATRGS